MKQLSLLIITLFALLASVGCNPESPSRETITPSQKTTADRAAPTITQEETTNPATTKERPTITDAFPSTRDETPPPPTGEKVEEKETTTTEDASMIIFSAPPIDVENIVSIVALGNLNPPSHVFPTDHIYFYISRQAEINLTEEVTLYSPGTLTVTRVNAIEHVQAGIVDYNVNLVQGNNLHVRLGHVSSLSGDIFGETSSFKNWKKTNEYTTGGETYRWWSKGYDLKVEAGQIIGTAGGNPNQWALDLFVYDLEQTQLDVANPERWAKSWYLHGVDPLSYYEDNPVFEQLLKLVDREISEGGEPPYGSVLQDMPGTAQGCWFLNGVKETYPEDPHLALVHDNIRPRFAVLSVGNSVRNLKAGTYEFLPQESGLLNRDFKDISANDKTFGFEVERFDGIIIIHMPDSETLWIEALSGVNTNPDQWIFSANKTTFNR